MYWGGLVAHGAGKWDESVKVASPRCLWDGGGAYILQTWLQE